VTANKHKVIEQYFERYAETEVRQLLAPLIEFHAEPNTLSQSCAYDALCVIPVYDEAVSSLDDFCRYECAKRIALVLVFNCPLDSGVVDSSPVENDSAAEQRTCAALNTLLSRYSFKTLSDGFFVAMANTHAAISRPDIYVIDRTQDERRLPEKQGVGLARKLGLDFALALSLVSLKQCHTIPTWLHSCDADVVLPAGYFDIPAPRSEQAVSLYPYRHNAKSGYETAMALYDLTLAYYVDRLSYAGSPYSFHTIGSTIAVTPKAYAQVRGMPKRSGGEDFYFLNKLAKVGCVDSLHAPILDIEGRPSARVPFGTGPALSRIQQMEDPLKDYSCYHPLIFERLKAVLAVAQSCSASQVSMDTFMHELSTGLEAKEFNEVQSVLQNLNIARFFNHLKKQTHSATFWVLFSTWFDAFVTLKFIHGLRDLAYPNVATEALQSYHSLLSNPLNDRIKTLVSGA